MPNGTRDHAFDHFGEPSHSHGDDEVMKQCKFWASKLPKSEGRKIVTYSIHGGTCDIAYDDKAVQEEIASNVDCEELCQSEDWDEEEEQDNDECVADCDDRIKHYSRGRVLVKPSGEIKDATIPFSCLTLSTQKSNDEGLWWDPEREAKFEEDLRKLGCWDMRDEMPLGWIHPHEFSDVTAGTEPDEAPAICYLHVQSKGPSQCMLDDVMDLIKEK